MGTLVGHIIPALALILLGLWHTINTIKSYLVKGPANFTVRFWYQFNTPLSRLKHLELVSILSFSVLAIFMQVLDFPHFQYAFKLDNFEHATMFIHLALFAGFSLSAELSDSLDLFSGFVGTLVSSVFSQELFLLHFHSTDHVGLEGHYHWLLQLIVLVSLVAAVAATAFPNNFTAALVLAITVIFQGCWFLNMGFALWFPAFVPEGCAMNLAKASGNDMLGAVTCSSKEAEFRARGLANLQFSWILSAILIFAGIVCLKLSRKCTIIERLEYERLQVKGADSTMADEGFKQQAKYSTTVC
ncbi:PREDICTED: transmembrane protein 45B [Lupinus angustifolius]|uniref:transmembrane protein 45B n=1 Tax=Lupinus angustifolius TaxID=3871 RepID=UPI00092FAAB6|nr:PREDICTED: transmembrane protein 45B [Lupinus angustifolius]XP_019454161.1 PREDICTED: transmembrane protein 45B [Lupinus angustifolius]XP_019454162.1 PREDICTED: transmembrane protein 45B [Lupinus angustifolius]